MTAKVIPLRRRPGDDLPDVTLTAVQRHAIAAKLRKLRQYDDTPREINLMIQWLTSPTRSAS